MSASSAELIYGEFGDGCDLYEVLGVAKTATDKDITRAYRKLALKYHPDKHRGDDASKAQATTKFQALCAIHALLSDAEARAYYDETGAVMSADGHEKSPSFQMWVDYFARIFPKVTSDDIAKFSGEYRFSDEERRDVLETYTKVQGDMRGILDSVMLSTDDDEARFAAMIDDAIEREQLKALPKWRTYAKQRAREASKPQSDAQRKKQQAKREREAREAEKLMNAIRGNQQERAAGAGVTALSAKRERGFDSLIASLETRYAEKASSKKQSRKGSKRTAVVDDDDDEPSEEAFLAAQKRLRTTKSRK